MVQPFGIVPISGYDIVNIVYFEANMISEKIPTIEKSAGVEQEKDDFKNCLSAIINKPLTVENIDMFADEALNELIKLIDDIKSRYRKLHGFYSQIDNEGKVTMDDKTDRGIEDEAFAEFGLPDISDFLVKVQNKIDQIKSIQYYIASCSVATEEVITPPNTGTEISIGDTDAEQMEDKKLIPRLTTLLYIIETDFQIPKEKVSLLKGGVGASMIREEPYYRVKIDFLNRVIYICDEEGNASYVFDAGALAELDIKMEKLDVMTKEERNELIQKYPDIGRRIVQSPNWRSKMSTLLATELVPASPTRQWVKLSETQKQVPLVSDSEFDDWRYFYTNEQGRHWGTINLLAGRFKISGATLKKIIPQHNLPSMDIGIAKTDMVAQAFCYEDVAALETTQLPRITATRGAKAGLYVNPETKQTYTTISALAKKCPLTYFSLEKIAREHKIPHLEVYSNTSKGVTAQNNISKVYLLDDFQRHIENYLKEREILPQAAEDGEWSGFCEINGLHYGSIMSISKKFEKSRGTINRIVKNNPDIRVIEKMVRPSALGGGGPFKGYCVEDIEQYIKDKK